MSNKQVLQKTRRQLNGSNFYFSFRERLMLESGFEVLSRVQGSSKNTGTTLRPFSQ